MKAHVAFRTDNPDQVAEAAQHISDLEERGFHEYSRIYIGPFHTILFERLDATTTEPKAAYQIVDVPWLNDCNDRL